MGLIKQQLEQPAGYWQISGKSIFTVRLCQPMCWLQKHIKKFLGDHQTNMDQKISYPTDL